jgi:hypothetical protein
MSANEKLTFAENKINQDHIFFSKKPQYLQISINKQIKGF